MEAHEAKKEEGLTREAGSFRDRNAQVYTWEGRILRALSKDAAHEWTSVEKAAFFSTRRKNGDIVATEVLEKVPAPPGYAALLEHQRLPFISYPYEWSFSMLKDAALLTLSLLEEAIQEQFILKDATPYNIQWQGSKPIFIDIPSLHTMREGQVWEGYRQFCELFLYPLMLNSYKEVPFHSLLRGNLEGISPEDFSRLFSLREYVRPGVLKHVVLHALLQKKMGSSDQDVKSALKNAGFSRELILANVRGLKKLTQRLSLPQDKTTEWSHYTDECVSYSDEEFKEKEEFLTRLFAGKKYSLAWDIGCNTGHFTRLLAKNSSYTIGFDIDPLAVERFYQTLKKEENTAILPLVLNVAQPSPGLGWLGKERKRIEERGRPDIILALAVIHHVVITGHIPLTQFVEWLARAGKNICIEFVTREDKMVQKLLRNKFDQSSDYDLPLFEKSFEEWFHLEERIPLRGGERILFVGRSKVS